jgi:hypothetical protein
MRPYLLSTAQLKAAAKPISWWKQHDLLPLVNISPVNPYETGVEAQIEETCQAIAALSPPGYLVEIACYSPDMPGPIPSLPAANWMVFIRNIGLLAASMKKHGGSGLVIDCEYYPASHGVKAMPPGTWKPDNRALGAGIAHALGPKMTLGAMVWAREFDRAHNPELAKFMHAGWQVQGHSYSRCLAEDYAGSYNHQKVIDLGATYLSGVYVQHGNLGHHADWLFDPTQILMHG